MAGKGQHSPGLAARPGVSRPIAAASTCVGRAGGLGAAPEEGVKGAGEETHSSLYTEHREHVDLCRV